MAVCARACRRTVATTEIRFWRGFLMRLGGQPADTWGIAFCGLFFTRRAGRAACSPRTRPVSAARKQDAASAAASGAHAARSRCAPRRPLDSALRRYRATGRRCVSLAGRSAALRTPAAPDNRSILLVEVSVWESIGMPGPAPASANAPDGDTRLSRNAHGSPSRQADRHPDHHGSELPSACSS
jgi:hypothetical protein